MRSLRFSLFFLLTTFAALTAHAQLYTGLSGLIHTPSADMNEEGTARIGGYFMNSHFTPDVDFFYYEGEKFNTADFFLSVVPFSWMEIGYTFTLQKSQLEGYDSPKYNQKDRYFSLKLRPLKEGKYWPAIVVGGNDIIGSPGRWHNGEYNHGYFSNYYVAATKHFTPAGQRIGVNMAYRHYFSASCKKWKGIVGGLTWQPSFAPTLRTIAEYTGDGFNVGADCLLWKHLFLQVTLQDGRHFSGGACYQVNLF